MAQILPTPPPTVMHGTVEIVHAIEALGSKLETVAKKDAISAWDWIKSNWLHLMNAGGIAAIGVKVFGLLAKL